MAVGPIRLDKQCMQPTHETAGKALRAARARPAAGQQHVFALLPVPSRPKAPHFRCLAQVWVSVSLTAHDRHKMPSSRPRNYCPHNYARRPVLWDPATPRRVPRIASTRVLETLQAASMSWAELRPSIRPDGDQQQLQAR